MTNQNTHQTEEEGRRERENIQGRISVLMSEEW